MCKLVSTWSEDTSRKVGSVIVGSANEIRSTGYNGLPRGVNGSVLERHARENDEKYHWFEHAERNAIFNAARAGVSIEACTIYSSVFPCSECSRAIIQSGIVRLKSFPAPENDKKYERSFNVAMTMFEEAGVAVELFVS